MPPQRRGHRDPAPPWGAHTSSGVGHSWKWIATSAARHRATVAPTSSTSAARASSDTTSTCFSKAPTLHVIHSTSTIGPSSGAAGCGPGRGEAALSGKARRGPISVPVRPRMQVSGGGGTAAPNQPLLILGREAPRECRASPRPPETPGGWTPAVRRSGVSSGTPLIACLQELHNHGSRNGHAEVNNREFPLESELSAALNVELRHGEKPSAQL